MTTTSLGKTSGRPRKLNADAQTIQQIKRIAGIQATREEAAALLGVHRDTFAKFLRDEPEAAEAWEDGLLVGKASLRRTQFKLAEKNAGMAIWLGKQLLGQKDQVAHQMQVEVNMTEVRNALASKLDRLAQLRGANGMAGKPH